MIGFKSGTREYQLEWNRQNPDKVLEYRRRGEERRKQRRAAETPDQREARTAAQRKRYVEKAEQIQAKVRARLKANRDEYLEKRRAQRERSPEAARAANRKWAYANRSKVTASTKRRKAAKRNQTPAWLTPADLKAMDATYARAEEATTFLGEPCHVDHIVPLRGETVSGLHVPWNLQVLHGEANVRKSNRLS